MTAETETLSTSPYASPTRSASATGAPQLAGTLWFMGWLFTIGFAQLVWCKAVLAVLAWPHFLGITLR